MTIELKAPDARLLVEPRHGGRLHQLFVDMDGTEIPLLFAPDDPREYEQHPLIGGCYPMAPWPNRIRQGTFHWGEREYRVPMDVNGEALHGLVFDRPWEVVARVGRVVEMTCAFGSAWPWDGRAWQRIELGRGFLAMKMEVRAGREAFPAGCGWHPWFRRRVGGSADAKVTVPTSRRYVLEKLLPTGENVAVEGDFALDGRPLGGRSLDDCYTGFERGAATIEWGGLRLEVAFECPRPHMQVYTRPDSFCLEPQTCAPDAFNLASRGAVSDGTAVVAPGRPLALSMRWTWSINGDR
ncbi:MAG: aldose 1-epimerase [Dehalococcoidia bacterium]